jgi:hypothetical protein
MKGRFAKIPEHALKANLTGRALRVLIAIGLHADPAGWAWPSLETIAELSGIGASAGMPPWSPSPSILPPA